MSHLATRDAERLADLEVTIAQGLATFVEVGAALAEIRDGRLYRETHGTFEDYCRERWQMSKRHADRLIGSAEVVGNLGPIGPIVPVTESQARPLTKLEPEQQREAWAQAVATAPDGKVTAAHVSATVDEMSRKERDDDMETVQARMTGARINLPDGRTAEEHCRDGFGLEQTGASADDVAAVLGISPQTYRRMRYIVLLADRTDLSAKDAETAGAALARMNREATVRHAYESVEPIVHRIYGPGAKTEPDRAEAIRRGNFDRAYGTLIQACSGAAAIDLPHLNPEEVDGVLAELKAAVQHVSTLRRRVQEEYQ